MPDFESIPQREWEKLGLIAEELEDELLFFTHYKSDYEFLRQCGIAWPQRSEPCSQ